MSLDRNAFALRGAEASIKWGYRRAAVLKDWTFAGSGMEGGTLTATVVERDAFNLTQAPLTLVLMLASAVQGPDGQPVVVGATPVKWPVREIVDQSPKVLVIVGPCERTSDAVVRSA